MKLTSNEQTLLRAFWTNEYVDGDECPMPWTFAVTNASGLPRRSCPAIFASLSKKGLIDIKPREEEGYNAASVTVKGFETARALGLIVARPRRTDPNQQYWEGAPAGMPAPTPKAATPKYDMIPSPRANPRGRLDAPWNVIDMATKRIVRRGRSRDDAELILHRLERRAQTEAK